MDNSSLIEQLDQALEALLAHSGAEVSSADAEVVSLLGVAAELRSLPREEFKLELKKDLQRRISMSAQAKPVQAESASPVVNPVRPGFRTVTPYIAVREALEVIEFVKKVFDAQGQIYGVGSQGGIHSEFKIGDAMLMIGGGGTWHGTPRPASLHIYVKDVDAVYERALQAGATPLHPPMDQEYGERSAAFSDAGGNYWYPATASGAHYILEGAQDVMPYLHPRGAAAQIEFLKEAFGAEEAFRHQSPDGVVHHAKLKIGTAIVELGEAHDQWQPMPGMFMMYVDDVDQSYAHAMRATGALSASEPADQPYGDRVGSVTDPFGNLWYIATHIKDIVS
ncbi:MAG: metalloprotein glyoxylase I/bleomycin resistance protein/type ring-cleaving dioxygenase family [Acidobacteria bacterium]|nr:metalloprotein glyoxylase I/bleomycin resistance protein/type ring-cleaving dioxygenase family [Acidobacteriota bacterium]